MSYEEANEICHRQRECGIIDLETLDPSVKAGLKHEIQTFLEEVELINRQYAEYRGASIEIYFYERDEFNAWSCIGEKADYIFLSFSPIVFLNNLISRIFRSGFRSDYFVLPNGQRDLGLQGEFQAAEEVDLRRRMWEGKAPAVHGKDDVFLANSMLRIGVQAILHHELAHIWNGHTEMMTVTKKKIIQQSELIDGVWNAHSYALEMDADCQSMRGLLQWFCRLIGYDLSRIPHDLPLDVPVSEESIIGMSRYNFTIGLVFSSVYLALRGALFLGGFKGDRSLGGPRHHPPMFFRILAERDEIVTMDNEIAPGFKDVAQMMLEDIIRKAETAFSETMGEPYVDLLSPEVTELFHGQYAKACECWKGLVPSLEPYKRGEKLRKYVHSSSPEPA